MQEKRTDWFMFGIAAALALFGAMMVYSASAMFSLRETESSSQFTYFYKQIGFTLIGLVAMFVVSRIDYHMYQKAWVVYGALALTAILLAAVFGFPEINGARRWIRLSGFSFQPSELAKIALPIFLAYYLTKNEDEIGEFKKTLLPCLLVFGILSALIFKEPDLGTVIVLSGIFATIYFAAGARLTYIIGVTGTLVVGGAAAVLFAPWRFARLMAFFDPCSAENAGATGYQVCQSLLGIGAGGVLGEGFAQGHQKLF